MNNANKLIVCLALASMASCFKSGDTVFSSKEAKGQLQTKEYDGAFDNIEVSSSIDAEVIKADQEKVVVSAPSDVISEVVVENSAGKLHVFLKKGFNFTNPNIKVKIFAKDFSRIEANSSASITSKDKFTQDKTDIEVTSSGDITGNFEANNLNINVGSSGSFTGQVWAVNFSAEATSSGSLDISGKAKNGKMTSGSSADIESPNLIIENAELTASSSSSIETGVSESLTAEAGSSASINVLKKGALKTRNITENSSGDVTVN